MSEEEAPKMHLFYYHDGRVVESSLPEETVRILCAGRDAFIYFFAYAWEMV